MVSGAMGGGRPFVLRGAVHRGPNCDGPFVRRYSGHDLCGALPGPSLQAYSQQYFDSASRGRTVFERLGGPRARAAAMAFWTDPNEASLASYEALCIPLYTRATPPAGFYERAVRNPAMRLVFFEHELRGLELLRRLDRIKCPTLIVAGEDDPITPVADMEDIVAAMRPYLVRFERFANAGHVVYRDRPGAFFRVLRDFIAA